MSKLKINIRLALISILIFSASSTKSVYADVSIDGLIVNKTISWFGRDFFSGFISESRSYRVESGQQVIVEERPSARKGSMIVIRYRGDVVFQTSISGTRSSSAEMGRQAVARVFNQVKNREQLASSSHYVDLYTDEI